MILQGQWFCERQNHQRYSKASHTRTSNLYSFSDMKREDHNVSYVMPHIEIRTVARHAWTLLVFFICNIFGSACLCKTWCCNNMLLRSVGTRLLRCSKLFLVHCYAIARVFKVIVYWVLPAPGQKNPA